MITQKHVLNTVLLSIFTLTLLLACHGPKQAENNTDTHHLVSLFSSMKGLPDTVHFFLPENPSGTIVSANLLQSCLDSTQFETLQFGTIDPQFWAVGKFELSKDVDACLLQTVEFWFGKQTLLFYHRKQNRIISILEVANFYGGDGGQTATEAWWFRKSVPSRFFIQYAEHGFHMHEAAEPTEYLDESGTLLQWDKSTFKAIPNPDSSLFLQKLKMHREW